MLACTVRWLDGQPPWRAARSDKGRHSTLAITDSRTGIQSPPTGQTRSRGMKKSTLLKLAVTIGLTAFVLARADLDALGQTFRAADWRWVLLAISMASTAMVINAGRWQ